MNKKAMIEKYGDECIYVIPFEELEYIKDGFTPIVHHSDLWKKFDDKGMFFKRYEVEGKPELQQIIPYIIITNETSDMLYTTVRLGGEERLIDKLSVACGGHINREDFGNEILFKAAVRELFEEVDVYPISPLKIVGYVRDKKSTTNDHTGIVISIKVSDAEINETENLKGAWMTLDELINNYEKMESWSKQIVDHYAENRYNKNFY